MKSPFPGVDPYLESQNYWQDFHQTFINYWREAIADALPESYEARLDERVQIVGLDPREDRTFLPDVSVVRKDGAEGASESSSEGSVATMEATTLPFPVMGDVRESFIEILHRPDRSLVAVLELLSPTNKSRQDHSQYIAKRVEIVTQPVHLIEVDLLLEGERLPMRSPLPPGDFYAIVSRAEPRRTGKVYAWTIKAKLPTIPIPLLPPDKDIRVDLSAVFSTAFERGRFAKSINYAAPLKLPLQPEGAAWAMAVGTKFAETRPQ